MSLKHRVLPVLALAAAALPAGAQQFLYDATALPAQNIWTDGVEIADVDGDGDNDILFANGSTYSSGGAQPQHLFLNDGAGNFSAAHANLAVANFNAKMVIAEDFDSDGDLDLMYAPEGAYPATTQVPRMLVNQGGAQAGVEGTFVNESATRIPNITMASFCVAAGDVDDDGDLDVVFTDGGTFNGVASQARLYLNDGNGFFSDATASRMPVDTYNAQDAILLDYDGDFDIDIALSGKGAVGKRGRLYLNDGTGTFTVSNALNNLGTSATYEIDWGDLDGDGDFDGAVQSITGTSEGWASNTGPNTAPVNTTFPAPNGGDDNEMGLMDYDADGDLDVFVASLASTDKIYRNDGGVFVNQNAAIQAFFDSTLDLGFGDLDGDDDYDVVTGQGESGNFTNRVFVNTTGTPDVTAPTIIDVEQPVGWSVGETVFHVLAQDAISDDGDINASATFSYTTNVGSGGGAATHMGHGLFRAAVPTTAGMHSIDVQFDVTDSAGNVAVANTDLAEAGRWTYVGNGTNGFDAMPQLLMTGPQTSGSLTTLSLTHAKPGAVLVFWLAFAPSPTPLWNGTAYAFPFNTQIITSANGNGAFTASVNWPAGIPTGTQATWQFLCEDNTVIWGGTLSNAVESTSP